MHDISIIIGLTDYAYDIWNQDKKIKFKTVKIEMKKLLNDIKRHLTIILPRI